MKHLKSFFYLFIIVLLLQFCKSSDPAPVTPVGTPEITEPGVPFGDLASTTIGSAGGTITSADGIVTLDIPVGALDANTTISIQPITNTAPLGVDGFSYRFSPDGQTFKKPAKLTFNYTPDLLNNTSPQLLWIVTQAKDGSWGALLKSSVDENTQTVSGEISHFSDWAVGRFMNLSIDPPTLTLNVNEGIILVVSGFSDIHFNYRPNPNNTEDDLAPLIPLKISDDGSFSLLTPSSLGGSASTFKDPKWSLAGEGKLIPNSFSSFSVIYKAPSQVPTSRNPVAVSIEMIRGLGNGVIPPTFRNVTLVSNITITEPGLLVINFKGTQYKFKQFENDNPITFVDDQGLRLVGLIPDASGFGPYFSISRIGTNIGTHVHGCMKNEDDVQYVNANLDVLYRLEWCEPNHDDLNSCTKVCNHFKSNITKFGKAGETIEGTFSGNLYDQNNGESVPITGYFKLVRTG